MINEFIVKFQFAGVPVGKEYRKIESQDTPADPSRIGISRWFLRPLLQHHDLDHLLLSILNRISDPVGAALKKPCKINVYRVFLCPKISV